MNHTPTPWHCEQDPDEPDQGWRIGWGEHPTAIAFCSNAVTGLNTEDAPANAAFIVRACNAHDDLLAACKTVLRRWTFNNYQQHTHSWHDMQDCAEIIRAALAKAEA